MAEKQVTTMLVKVDLACEKCRKKIKKVLCDIPQIQNQGYNEKDNVVLITVVCCSPEKVKKMICCKGGKTVKGIEILKPRPQPPPPDKPKKDKPTDATKPPAPEPNKPSGVVTVVEQPPAKPPSKAPKPTPKPPEPAPKPVPIGYPPQPPVPTCCRECYEGYGRGPCWGVYEGPSGPCYGRPVYDNWGGGYCRPVYVCEENPNAACSIM